MKVYFYHTEDINAIEKHWKAGKYPAHLLYGATHLKDEGIDVIMHKYTDGNRKRLWRMFDVAYKVLTCREHFDAIYATRHNGMELIVLLRAFGLFHKPIVMWHHQPVEKSKNKLKEIVARIFYRGIDHLFFFSNHLKDISDNSNRLTTTTTQQCPWGAELEFYDRIRKDSTSQRSTFISTGKEMRDMPTLVSAFAHTPRQRLKLIAPSAYLDTDFEELFEGMEIPHNVTVNINRTMTLGDIAHIVAEHHCVCICCRQTNYTAGLTTLVEAMALGMPVIISQNPNQPFDASEEGCGISVPYSDVEGWIKAIQFIADNPVAAKRMGERGREMAENTYNIRNTTHIVAEALKRVNRLR